MSQDEPVRAGGCACGAVRFVARGAPARAGLCHCLTCQKAHAAPFYPFVVFVREQVEVTGATVGWQSSAGYDRRFCAACGSRAYALAEEEIELSISSFDDPSAYAPEYESWTIRRLPWVTALAVPQFDCDRVDQD